jgi:hypothetical protein
MYIQYSIEAHSRNHYCHVKAIGIAYFCVRTQVSACVWVQGAGVCFHACSLTHPACNAHAPFRLWPRWLHQIFRHYLTNGTISGKKVDEHKMCVLIFSTSFIRNTSHSKKDLARYCPKCKLVFM